MKNAVIGIFAHVDAGKTTLSEGILYKTGVIRRLGRVDNGDAYLDWASIEKERGITVFAGQADFTFRQNPTAANAAGQVALPEGGSNSERTNPPASNHIG